MLDKIARELFKSGTILTYSDDPYFYGKTTASKEVFYHQNDCGYFLYLPKITQFNLFEPIEPTGFRWSFFNRQIIFVPNSTVQFNKIYRVHPKMNDYIIRFNLEYLNRYKKVFIESADPRQDQFFLLRRPSNYITNFDTMQPDVDDFYEFDKDSGTYVNVNLETKKVTNLVTIPEFLNSNEIHKIITDNNLDDIWKHWLAAQYGNRLLDPTDHYYKKYSDDTWIGNVVSHLVVENLIEREKPVELDYDLKRLLGLI